MQTARKRFTVSLRKFADDTTIHGFKDLVYANSAPSSVFWALVMLISSCLTIFHIVQTISHYSNQATMTTVKTVQTGDLILPDLMLCYEHWMYWVNWKKVVKLGFTKESAMFGLSYLSEIYTDKPINKSRARLDFLRQMNANNMSYISQFFRAIAHSSPQRVVVPEALKLSWFHTLEFSFYDPISLCYVTPGKQLVEDTRKEFFGSQAYLTIRNERFVDFSEFLSPNEYVNYVRMMLVNEGLLKFRKDENGRDASLTMNFTEFQLPIWMHANKKHKDGLMLSPDIAAYTITIRALVREMRNRPDKPCRESARQANLDIDCHFRCFSLGYFNKCDQCLPIQKAISLNMDMMLESLCQNGINVLSHQSTHTTTSTVSPPTTMDSDLYNQFSNRSVQFDSSVNSSAVAVSPAGSPSACQDEALQMKCREEQCVPACELWDFDKSVSLTVYPKFLHKIADQDRTMVLINYPSEENIFIMSDVDSLTWDGLIANIGGLLGIWVGASIVSFIQMFYRCFACFNDDDCNIRENCLPLEKSKEKGKAIIVRHTAQEQNENFV